MNPDDREPDYSSHPTNMPSSSAAPHPNHIIEVIKRIKPHTGSGSTITLPDGDMTIDAAHFRTLAPTADDRRITFVDGGQCTVFSSPTLHIEFIRIFWSKYNGTQRVSRDQSEVYLLITTIEAEGELHYKIESIPDRFSFPLVSLSDPTLCTKGHSVAIASVASLCRALCEYSIIGSVLGNSESGDIICRDGDLDGHNATQERMIQELDKIATHRGVSLVGVSKTTTLLSNTGSSAIAALASLAPQDAWTYQAPGSRIAFARFHARAEHIFRVDTLGSTGSGADPLAALARHGTDPAFLGYPYGLLDADMNARVGSEEKEYLKTLFWANIGDQHDTMKLLSSATDGHSMLDRIKYR